MYGVENGLCWLMCIIVVILIISVLGPLFMCLVNVYVADFKLEYLIA